MIEINCRVVAKYINSDPDQEKVFSPIKGILKEDVLASCPLAADCRDILDPSRNCCTPTSIIWFPMDVLDR